MLSSSVEFEVNRATAELISGGPEGLTLMQLLQFFERRPAEEALAVIAQERGVHLDLGLCESW